MNTKIGIWVCACTGLLGPEAQGELLATYDSILAGGSGHVFDSVTGSTYLSDVFNAPDGFGTLFEEIVIFDGETRVDTVTDSDDPDFAAYAELLTDGIDWWLYDGFEFAGGSRTAFHLESVRLDFTDPQHRGVDLSGYEIESVTRTMTVMLDSPGSDPNGNGIWTDFEVNTVFEIHGTIPEPSSLVVLALGNAAAFVRRRRKR